MQDLLEGSTSRNKDSAARQPPTAHQSWRAVLAGVDDNDNMCPKFKFELMGDIAKTFALKRAFNR
jgi:hypothetical protein